MNHVLLAITGYSPQVITEAIYAAKQQLNIEFSDIKVITTMQGKQRIEQALLHPTHTGKTQLQCLYEDYDITPLAFGLDDIWIPELDGVQLEDVKTEQEIQACADFVLDKIKYLTDNSEQLFTLMAGGRKTMTFYVGYAMTLYGRYGDTLNHVFVSPEFERSQFFYPPKNKQFISSHSGHFFNTQEAEVHLSKVPYLHMRDSLPEKLIEQSLTYSQAIAFCDSYKHPVELLIDLNTHQLTCSGQLIDIQEVDFAFYWMFVEDFLNERSGFICPSQHESSEQLALHYLNTRACLHGLGENKFTTLDGAVSYVRDKCETVFITDKELNALEFGMTKSWFNSRKNTIKKALYFMLPKSLAEHYDIGIWGKVKRVNAQKEVLVQGLTVEQDQITVKQAVLGKSALSEIAAKQWPIT